MLFESNLHFDHTHDSLIEHKNATFISMLELTNVTKRYQIGNDIWELKDVNFTISEGEFVAITGVSGSGKSTLLHLMGGLDRPDEGEISFEGQKLSEMSDTAISRFRNKEIGYVFQEFFLYPDINLVQNIALPLLISNGNAKKRRKEAFRALEEVGLTGLEEHNMNEISGGQRQRTAIARAIVHRPRLLLADEPTGNLDSKTGGEILDLLKVLHNKHKMTLVIVTHDQAIASIAKRHIRLKDGKIIKDEV